MRLQRKEELNSLLQDRNDLQDKVGAILLKVVRHSLQATAISDDHFKKEGEVAVTICKCQLRFP